MSSSGVIRGRQPRWRACENAPTIEDRSEFISGVPPRPSVPKIWNAGQRVSCIGHTRLISGFATPPSGSSCRRCDFSTCDRDEDAGPVANLITLAVESQLEGSKTAKTQTRN